MIENAGNNIQRDSLTRLTGVSEELFRNLRHSEESSKKIQLPWKCKDTNACNGEPNERIDYSKPCSGSMNCENRGKKVKKDRFKTNIFPATPFSGFKRILEDLARKSPCPAENPRCERKRAELTTRTIAYQCPAGLKCVKNGRPRRVKRACQTGFNCANGELKNDDSSAKLLHENKMDEGKKHCPVGLWCSPKRKVDFESSDSLEDCPPGLWCKRSGIQTNGGSFTKRVNKNREEYRCPTGLWCSVKREEGYENLETLSQCPPGLWCKRDNNKRDDDRSIPRETDIAKFEQCPTGLWCSSKREVGFENSDTLQHCPPGLWCKKNTIVSDDDNTERNNIAERCPTGLWCSFKRRSGYQNSETLRQCPPGLWCKRSVQNDIFKEKKSAKRLDCPTGLWCALKREVANVGVSDDCPPGLWCKRNEDALIEREDNCAKVSWCSLKRKLRNANKISLARK